MPSGGGAIRSISQTFSVNPVNGTSGVAIALPGAEARLAPGIGLSYNSGVGNGPFGIGWSLGLGGIERLTARRLPRYRDGPDGDVFVFAGAEELVPAFEETAPGTWDPDTAQDGPRSARRYRPRIEGDFARIERVAIPGEPDHWRVTSRDNVVTVYGRTAAARIADPQNPARVFRWLPEWRYDDKGNAIRFTYVAEDLRGVPDRPEEAQRRAPGAFSNLHLKRVSYGNRAPFSPDTAQLLDPPAPPDQADAYMFHLVLDYGDHDDAAPALDPDRDWPMRHDPFSDHRSGFEVRTYRLCRRVLMFNVFDELRAGPLPEIVRSVEFRYRHMAFDDSPPERAEVELLERVQERGWRRTGPAQFLTRTGPETAFDYAEPAWDRTVREIAQEDSAGAPQGFTGPYQPVDLDGNGISGIVHGAAGGLWYKRNLGEGRFAAPEPLPESPAVEDFALGRLRFEDVDGTGRPAMVMLDRGRRGAFLAEDDGFAPFRPFARDLPFDVADPRLRFADLDGDGRADALTLQSGRLTWWRGAGLEGFDPPEMAPAPVVRDRDTALETGADGGAATFFADMSGDGLPDYVRVTRSGVSYWPNLGYGRFGAEVRMAGAPVLDAPDAFDARLVRLADLSGVGPQDLIYLGGAEIRVWVNLAGNGFAPERSLGRLSGRGSATGVGVFDILGQGTSALVLSSPLPADAQAPMRYIDPMGGRKPWLMTAVSNGLGAETRVTYRAASAFALDDRRAGRPWATRLPLPVMCVAETTTTDAVTGARITRAYRYRHGYYDGAERAFRGFAMVETRDTEEFEKYAAGAGGALIDQTLFAPPAVQRSWFHTGAWPGGIALAERLAEEYYDSPATPEARPANGHVLPPAPRDAAHRREAARALKGAPLRVETWSEDGTPAAATPYATEDRAPALRLVQPALNGYPAVYLVYERERVVRHYERAAADPRVLHSLAIEVDDIGNVTSQASVAYGRGTPDPGLPPEIQAEQARTRVTHVATTMTGDVLSATVHRRRQVAEVRTFEVLGLSPAGPLFVVDALAAAIAGAPQIGVETPAPPGPARRPLSARRSLYAQDLAPDQPLPLGTMESLALTFEDYDLAFDGILLAAVYGTDVSAAVLDAAGYISGAAAKADGRFPAADVDDDRWAPSGRLGYGADPRADFYLPRRFVDPFGAVTQVNYHADGRLFVVRVDDALGNRTEVEAFDFRVLEPTRVRDINDNLSEVIFDALGRVAGEAERGKGAEGDSLVGFDPDPDQPAIETFFADPLGQAAALLGDAGMRVVHDRSHQPAWAATIERTRHAADGAGPGELIVAFAYTGGGGGVVMTKAHAAPGSAQTVTVANDVATVDTVDADQRWVGNGRKVLDNKGRTVMAFEPYFAVTHDYETAPELVEQGVTDVVHYDPLGRVDRTDHPDGTFSRVERSVWGSRVFDRGDTVLASDWYAARIGGGMGPDALDAAQKSVLGDDTPGVVHLDPLGEEIWSVAHARGLDRLTGLPVDTFPATRVIRRATGQPEETIDPRGNSVIRHRHDLMGRPVETVSMETGVRRVFPDAADKPVMGWDAKGGRSRTEYDLLGRPTLHFYRPAAAPEATREQLVYGTDPLANSNGALVTHFDNAGRIDHTAFDFKGNILRSERRFTDALAEPDWTNVASLPMAAEVHVSEADWDARSRVTARRSADGSEARFFYDPADLLVRQTVSVRGGPVRDVISAVRHDAHGRRARIDYANGVTSRFEFDRLTQRIARVETTRASDGALLQDLRFTYDAVGNVTLLRDHAQQTVYFNNQVVEATQRFTYDSLSRLIRAEGREHAASHVAPDRTDAARSGLVHPADGGAMQGYREFYTYDLADNLIELAHNAGLGQFQNRWTRTFTVDAGTNRLTASYLGAQVTGFAYDAHGNLAQIPGLGPVAWDDADRMATLDLGGGGSAAYAYDGDGNRVRKLIDRGGGQTEERLYVGPVEIFRRRQGAAIVLERETLHLMDGKRRLAMVETRTQGADPGPVELMRYQFANHLGTVALELDDAGAVISHEEYYPFGATSVQSRAAGREVPEKRYRHTGKERDEESGLYYHGARYYMSWLCRWTSPDPAGLGDGLNQWSYARNNPVRLSDPTGALSWGQWAGIAAAVVVGTVVTVATAGLAGPVVGTAAATVIGGIVGGAAAGAVGEVVEASVDGRPVTAGNVVRAAVVGAVVGGVLAGAGTAVSAGLRTAAGRAATARVAASVVGRAAQAVARSGPGRTAGNAIRAVGRAAERLQEPHRRAGEAIGRRIPGSAINRAESSAAQRLAETLRNVQGNAASRSAASATGEETFVHATGRQAVLPGQAEASIEAQQALRLSPGGATGQYGEGAYAYRGTLEQFPGAHFEFTVPPGTAVETIIPRSGGAPIQRLVPPAGQTSVPINITGTNVAEETLEAGRRFLGSALPGRTPFTLLQPGLVDRLSLPGLIGGASGLTIGPSDPLPNPANLPDQPPSQLPSLKLRFGP